MLSSKNPHIERMFCVKAPSRGHKNVSRPLHGRHIAIKYWERKREDDPRYSEFAMVQCAKKKRKKWWSTRSHYLGGRYLIARICTATIAHTHNTAHNTFQRLNMHYTRSKVCVCTHARAKTGFRFRGPLAQYCAPLITVDHSTVWLVRVCK